MKRLRWKKEKQETGLASVGAGPRSSVYHDGKIVYAKVFPLGGSWRGPLIGWFWVAGWDSCVTHKNTADEPCQTEGEAKKQAADYVQRELNRNKSAN